MYEEEQSQRPKSAGDFSLEVPPNCFIDGVEFRTCRVFKKKYFNIKGYHLRFMLQSQKTNRFHAKCKPFSGKNLISVCENKEPHLGNENDYFLIYDKEMSTFSLRKEALHGKELMTIKIHSKKNEPREIFVIFHSFDDNSVTPNVLKSAKPVLICGIKWCVNLHTKSVKGSIKNCCLEDENQNPYVFIRKISDNVLEIEYRTTLPDVIAFSLGIASFVCK